jgi:hypothetical protein
MLLRYAIGRNVQDGESAPFELMVGSI